MSNKIVVPSQVTLSYRVVGEAKTHVFTCEELPGLHIGSSSLRKAFNEAFIALGEHVSHISGQDVSYAPSMDFNEFNAHLENRTASPRDMIISRYIVAKQREEARA